MLSKLENLQHKLHLFQYFLSKHIAVSINLVYSPDVCPCRRRYWPQSRVCHLRSFGPYPLPSSSRSSEEYRRARPVTIKWIIHIYNTSLTYPFRNIRQTVMFTYINSHAGFLLNGLILVVKGLRFPLCHVIASYIQIKDRPYDNTRHWTFNNVNMYVNS